MNFKFGIIQILPKYLGSFPPGKSETFLNFTCFQTIKVNYENSGLIVVFRL